MSALRPWSAANTGPAFPQASGCACSEGGALTSTTPSSTHSSPAATAVLHACTHIDSSAHNNSRRRSGDSPRNDTEDQGRNNVPQRMRQWTPRRRSSATPSARSGSEGTVTTVRDWVRSAGCSPSKQPRSSSDSRREDLVISFASALVPRDERSSPSDTEEEEEGEGNISGMMNSARGDVARDSHGTRSPQRTASWRNLRSHPGGASSRFPQPPFDVPSSPSALPSLPGTPTLSRCGSWTSTHASTNCDVRERDAIRGQLHAPNLHHHSSVVSIASTAATSMQDWPSSGMGGRCGSPALSGVSSPSVLTPLSSRCPSPAVFAGGGDGASHRPLPPPPSLLSMRERELAQMREWHCASADAPQQQQQQQVNATSTGEAHVWREQSRRPPTVPHNSFHGGRWGRCSGGDDGDGGGDVPLSARSDSVSRVSFASTRWSDQRGSGAATSLGWRSSGTDDGGAVVAPLSSACSSRSLSPVSFSHGWSGCGGERQRCGGGGGGQQENERCTSPLSSPSFSFPHPSSAEAMSLMQARGGVTSNVGDARTMEDIEDANAKRTCVESPTSSPMLASLSLSLGSSAPSLAEALAAQPLRIALPSEAHLWEQRERRRRATSPSLARADEDEVDVSGTSPAFSGSHHHHHQHHGTSSSWNKGVVEERAGGGAAAAAAAASSPPCSPLVSAARAAAAASSTDAPPWSRKQAGASSPLAASGRCGASPSLAPVREATVAPSAAAALRLGVVEVGADEEGVVVPGRAASLSFCSASEDEPEVDTFALERAQAVMEDADAEVVGELLARQHRLHVQATSDFALDLQAHGGHVDPALWESEVDPSSAMAGGARRRKRGLWEEETSGAARHSADSPPPHFIMTHNEQDEEERGLFSTSPVCSPMSPPPVQPPATTAASERNEGGSTRCTSSATAAPSSPSTTGRISGNAYASVTPPRPKRPTAQHVRWGLPEEVEEARSPGSATTCSSHSLRDVSPPVRERSLAPAELRREKAEE